ncbi:metallophosphoesterase [Nocardia camponoti]|uniref:Acid phosphatase n=1 Tax=Nocardia camponoti TaxID=1616106 RepID=A0A917Q8M6_9NOCA|nr:metallophosphoesterase [Nocardia camponoti]GGK36214.1 acid phosphatase [Nocardia camponoti]
MRDVSPGIDRRAMLGGMAAGLGLAGGLLGLSPAAAVPAEVTKYGVPQRGSSVRALLTGDAGTGTRTQWTVADAARSVHARTPFDLAIGLGDNIYETGPNGPDDTQFADKFENPNAGLDFPWAMVLGNHDTSSIFPGDGGWLARGNDEVAYHAKSARWWMPSRYYSVRVPEVAPIVEFFILDVNPLAAYIPPLLDPYWAVNGTFMNEQRAWLDQALASSTAQWKIACTHQPYLSNGPHGNAGNYEGLPIEPLNGVHAKRFFEDHVLGKVSLLLSGHDHTLQVLEPTVACKGTRQIVSGAAAKTSSGMPRVGAGTNPEMYYTQSELGFMVLDATTSSLGLKVMTVDPATGHAATAFERRLA